jgi:nitroreductase
MTDALIAPLAPDPAALAFLLSRRSRPAKTLAEPGPDRDRLALLLTAAARCPDHGKLEPWGFVVLAGAARPRLAALTRDRAMALGHDAAAAEKDAAAFSQGGVVVAVVSAAKASAKIPEWEQRMSAGAVCLGLVNACLADGWGANWLTGWAATDPEILAALEIAPPDFVAGFIHIGTETVAPPERPRPDIAALTRWVEA